MTQKSRESARRRQLARHAQVPAAGPAAQLAMHVAAGQQPGPSHHRREAPQQSGYRARYQQMTHRGYHWRQPRRGPQQRPAAPSQGHLNWRPHLGRQPSPATGLARGPERRRGPDNTASREGVVQRRYRILHQEGQVATATGPDTASHSASLGRTEWESNAAKHRPGGAQGLTPRLASCRRRWA